MAAINFRNTDIPPHSGSATDEDIEVWMKKYETYSEACGWNEEKKLKVLPLFMKDSAEVALQNLQESKEADRRAVREANRNADAANQAAVPPALTWDETKQNLIGTLKTVGNERIMQGEFSRRLQGTDEAVGTYGFALLRLARKAWPKLPLEDVEALALQRFIDGTQSDYRSHLILREYHTLKEAINHAQLLESVKGRTGPSTSGTGRSYASPGGGSTNQVNILTESLKSDSGELDMKEMLKQLQELSERMKPRSPGNGQSQRRLRDRSEEGCFECGAEGHFARDCDQRRRRLESSGYRGQRRGRSPGYEDYKRGYDRRPRQEYPPRERRDFSPSPRRYSDERSPDSYGREKRGRDGRYDREDGRGRGRQVNLAQRDYSDEPFTCWACGEVGHRKSECAERRRRPKLTGGNSQAPRVMAKRARKEGDPGQEKKVRFDEREATANQMAEEREPTERLSTEGKGSETAPITLSWNPAMGVQKGSVSVAQADVGEPGPMILCLCPIPKEREVKEARAPPPTDDGRGGKGRVTQTSHSSPAAMAQTRQARKSEGAGGIPKPCEGGRRQSKGAVPSGKARGGALASLLLLLSFSRGEASLLPLGPGLKQARGVNPLLCGGGDGGHLWRLPQSFPCQVHSGPPLVPPQPKTLTLFKSNLLAYKTEAFLCSKVKTVWGIKLWFFNDNAVTKKETFHEKVSEEECREWIGKGKCEYGELEEDEEGIGVRTTRNVLDESWPTPPVFSCCRWVWREAGNCAVQKTAVAKRHNGPAPVSPAADLSHCDYNDGHCSLHSNASIVWTVSPLPVCKVIPHQTMKGNQVGPVWVSEDENIVLTFYNRSHSVDCERSLIHSDQGVWVEVEGRVRERGKREGKPGEREESPPEAFVAAQLQAVSEANARRLMQAFTSSARAICHLAQSTLTLLRAMLVSDPTSTMRELMNEPGIIASQSGGVIRVTRCLELSDRSFKLLPNPNCPSDKIPINYVWNNRSYNGLMDIGTNEIVGKEEEQRCGRKGPRIVRLRGGSYTYRSDGTLFPLDESQLEQLPLTHQALNVTLPHTDVVFHSLLLFQAEALREAFTLNERLEAGTQREASRDRLEGKEKKNSLHDVADFHESGRTVSLGLWAFLLGGSWSFSQLATFLTFAWVTIVTGVWCCCPSAIKANPRWAILESRKRWLERSEGPKEQTPVSITINNSNAPDPTRLQLTPTVEGGVWDLEAGRMGAQSSVTIVELEESDEVTTSLARTRPLRSITAAAMSPYRPRILMLRREGKEEKGSEAPVAGPLRGLMRPMQATYYPHPVVPMRWKNQIWHCLVDTGCNTTLLSKKIADELLNTSQGSKPPVQEGFLERIAAAGADLRVIRWQETEICLGDQFRSVWAAVIDEGDMPGDIILGTNVIKKFGVLTIDWWRGELRVGGDWISFCYLSKYTTDQAGTKGSNGPWTERWKEEKGLRGKEEVRPSEEREAGGKQRSEAEGRNPCSGCVGCWERRWEEGRTQDGRKEEGREDAFPGRPTAPSLSPSTQKVTKRIPDKFSVAEETTLYRESPLIALSLSREGEKADGWGKEKVNEYGSIEAAGPLPAVRATFGGQDTMAVVDTGADASSLPRRSVTPVGRWCEAGHGLQSATGPVQVLGRWETTVEIAGVRMEAAFMVLEDDDLPFGAVIGTDLLARFGWCTINLCDGWMSFGGRRATSEPGYWIERPTPLPLDRRWEEREERREEARSRLPYSTHTCFMLRGEPAPVGRLALVPATLGKYECCVLADSGATISCVPERTKVAMGARDHDVTRSESRVATMGGPISVRGKVWGKLRLGEVTVSAQFSVIDDNRSTYDAVIGTDVLEKIGFIGFDFGRGVMRVRDSEVALTKAQAYSLTPENPSTKGTVVAASTTIIPPRTAKMVRCKQAWKSQQEDGVWAEGQVMCLEPAYTDIQALTMKQALSTVKDGVLLTEFCNWGRAPVTLNEGRKVAVAEAPLVIFNPEAGEGEAEGRIPVLPVPKGTINSLTEIRQLSREELMDAFDWTDTEAPESVVAELKDLLWEFRTCFAQGPLDVGHCTVSKFEVDTGDSPPVQSRPYRIPEVFKDEVKSQLEQMQQRGIIRPSVSPWQSSLIVVKKPSGGIRLVHDFRKVNAVTRKTNANLPRIDELLDSLGRAYAHSPTKTCVLSSCDLLSGYWNLALSEEAASKTAFTTPFGSYEYRVMPMGLASAGSHIQRVLEHILAMMQYTELLVYLDDVLLFHVGYTEHLDGIRRYLERLRRFHLKLKPSKCKWLRRKVLFLGHTVSGGGIGVDEGKTKALKDLKSPDSVKALQSILGLLNFYKRFIPLYSTTMAPLFRLLRKGSKFSWNSEYEAILRAMIEKLTKAPILAFPDFSKEFVIATDASGFAIGCVVSQLQGGEERPVAYYSRSLDRHQRNYSTIERELFAAVWAIGKCKHYVYGKHFTLLTDHSPLKAILTTKSDSPRLQRWALALQEYDFTVTYKKGSSHGNADGMSRAAFNPTQNSKTAEVDLDAPIDDTEMEMMPGFEINSLSTVEEGKDADGETRQYILVDPTVYRAQRADPWLGSILAVLIEGEEPPSAEERKRVKLAREKMELGLANLLYCREPNPGARSKPIVAPASLIAGILQEYHNELLGHLAFARTLARIRNVWWWEGMYTTVMKYCMECLTCGKTKPLVARPRAPLVPLMVVPPGTRWSVDCAGPFALTERGNLHLVVFYESATRWVEAHPVPDTKSKTIAKIFISEIIARWGSPCVLVSDGAKYFLTDLIKAVNEIFQVSHITATPYHPMTVGGLERWNQLCGSMLRAYCEEQPRLWDEYICFVLLAYRSAAVAGLGDSPSMLFLGRDLLWPREATQTPIPTGYREVEDYRADLVLRLQEANRIAKEHTEKQQSADKRRYDEKVRAANFVDGDRVWLEFPKSAAPVGSCRKLVCTRKGPFRVVSCSFPVYYIRPCDKPKAKPVAVHANRLSACYEPKFPSLDLEEEGDEEEGEEAKVLQFPSDWQLRRKEKTDEMEPRKAANKGRKDKADSDEGDEGSAQQPQPKPYNLRPRRSINM